MLLHCDFCSELCITKAYTCEPFITTIIINGHPLIMESNGRWAACETCAKLIEANRWEELRNRSIETSGLASSPERELLEAFLVEYHGAFRRLKGEGRTYESCN